MKRLLSVFLISSFIVLLTHSPVMAQNPTSFTIEHPSSTVAPGDVSIQSAIFFILNTLVIVGIIASLIYLLYGGVKWITSGGDKGAVEQARQHIIAAIVGLIIIALAFVILNIVAQLLGIQGNIFTICIPTLSTSCP